MSAENQLILELRKILHTSRLMKSSLLAFDLPSFLDALEKRGQLIKRAELLSPDGLNDAELEEKSKIITEVAGIDAAIKPLHEDALVRLDIERKKTRKDINKIDFPRKVMKKYTIEGFSGSRLDHRE